MSPDRQPATGTLTGRALQEHLYQQYNELFAARKFEEALAVARHARTLFSSLDLVYAEAVCLNRLDHPQEAYEIASNNPPPQRQQMYFDLMAEICGALGKQDEMRANGSASLALRDSIVAAEPRYPLPEGPPPRIRGKGQVIAYSLFGASPRYCEVAIMNCVAAARLLPDWRCRFYCDETVPSEIFRRITEAGGEIRMVDAQARESIPALMWRFLAADDPDVSRFLMRDANSLIGEREVAAVQAWLESGRWFHVMRDNYTHTEIMLAGLWGGCTGVIPDMRREMIAFVKPGDFVPSHVDQHFLRKRVWPTVRQSVLSHDRLFHFFNNEPFPHVPGASLDLEHHIGINLSTRSLVGEIDMADGEIATMLIFDELGRQVCAYKVHPTNRTWQISIPDSYAEKVRNNEWVVRFA
ncbi:MAG: hypothetical protein M9924_17250 [Rhizobiaceae bacterium]|nr:hypothetical protein [Rhizobiaceae bacterium]